ncbi:hypothetical protein FRAAL6798 [Frankia alni ACN14a]|uniref:Uncharacterized protein n=1 Tax=Frankia alni (strain DSM 45986 / CECT 9034 / ACN14a) TaxID=326424 RepID=Q0RAJ5_FRAAA|nr:hypothetical protein FRAAL6798 [Frankia alni ACN14a]
MRDHEGPRPPWAAHPRRVSWATYGPHEVPQRKIQG